MRRRLRVCMRSSGRPGSDALACLRLGKHRICPYKSSLQGVPLPWVTESRRGRLWSSESSILAMGPRLPQSRGRSMGRPALPGGRFCSSGPGAGIPIGAGRRPIGWRDLQHNGNRELPQVGRLPILLFVQIGQKLPQPQGPGGADGPQLSVPILCHLDKSVPVVVKLCFITVG